MIAELEQVFILCMADVDLPDELWDNLCDAYDVRNGSIVQFYLFGGMNPSALKPESITSIENVLPSWLLAARMSLEAKQKENPSEYHSLRILLYFCW